MSTQITNFQCPACTGPLHYDGESGKLKCEYCGSLFPVKEIEALYGEKIDQAAENAQAAAVETEPVTNVSGDGSWDWDAAGTDWGEEAAHLKAYNCPSCGAELICDETTVATSCPYCGNPSVVPGQFTGMLKPDYILPFKLDKEAAVRALKQYYQGKKLLPRSFRNDNHIEEVKGVYVPFWLFDATADADLQFSATQVRSYSQGDKRITETDHYRVRRAGTVDFIRIPVDGSKKMPDAHMDAIEPFDYSELKPFSAAYLPGFLADKYDMDAEECERRADFRAGNTAEDIIRSTVTGYSTCTTVGKDIRVHRGNVKYAMLPVWMLATRWKGKSFLFAMNGQTGKLIGDLPVAKDLYWSWFARIALPIAAAIGAFLHFYM